MTARTLLLALLALAGAAFAGEAGKRRALLIGISKYKSRDISNLNGALNDLESVSRVLAARYGFSPRDMTLLRNEQATRKAILAALTGLVRAAGPDDVVYVHFSGHGSFRPDQNGDETDDGRDETLIPWDGRTPGVPDIVDDELGPILARLRTDKAVLVFDSCHSGTVTRSPVLVARMIPPDDRDELYRSAGLQARSVLPVLAQRFVVFSGAQPDQQALDGPCEGRYHGLFSYSFVKSLLRSPPGASPLDVLKGAEAELRRLKIRFGRPFLPEPHLEARDESRLNQPLFPPSKSGVGGIPWLAVKRAGKSGRVLLADAGEAEAPVGSAWGVFGPGETEPVFGRALAQATVTGHEAGSAVATLEPAGAAIPEGAHAVALMTPRGDERVPVRLAKMSEADRAALARALALHPVVRLVEEGEFARFMIDRRRGAWALFGAAGQEAVAEVDAAPTAAAAQRIAAIVARWQLADELVSLENQASAIRLEVALAGQAGPELRPGLKGRSVGVSPSSADVRRRFFRPGGKRTLENHLVLEVRADRPCYLTVVDVDGEGNVNVLFPNDYQHPDFLPGGRIPGGETVRIPDSLEEANHAGFVWDLRPPAGLDTIRVFATVDRGTAEAIRRHIARLAAGEAATGRLGALRGELLARSVGVTATHPTGGQDAPPARDWAAATVTFRTGE